MLMLDADVVIDVLNEDPNALRWLSRHRDEELALPGFVVLELLLGCRNRRETRQLEETPSGYAVFLPTEEDCEMARANFAQLYLQHGTGIIDAPIAYTAAGMGVTLCTFNQKHYRGINGLTILRPYSRRRPRRPPAP